MAVRDVLIVELKQVRARNTQEDAKQRTLTTEDVKECYGRLPNYGDALMMPDMV